MDVSEHDVRALQRHFPRVYFACHVRHVRARTTEHGLSDRDSMLLGHLDEREPWSPGDLAAHFGVAPSTMSETLNRLERAGYVVRAPAAGRRGVELRLTTKGAEAMAATSVLDAGRVRALLDRLEPARRRRALDGLRLLAAAADALRAEEDPS